MDKALLMFTALNIFGETYLLFDRYRNVWGNVALVVAVLLISISSYYVLERKTVNVNVSNSTFLEVDDLLYFYKRKKCFAFATICDNRIPEMISTFNGHLKNSFHIPIGNKISAFWKRITDLERRRPTSLNDHSGYDNFFEIYVTRGTSVDLYLHHG